MNTSRTRTSRAASAGSRTRPTAPPTLGSCVTPAFIAASYAHLGRGAGIDRYRQTVGRHYRYQLARGDFTEETGCVDWLLGLDPFQRAEDAEHYEAGLRMAGFE